LHPPAARMLETGAMFYDPGGVLFIALGLVFAAGLVWKGRVLRLLAFN
jgi:hypothetical protein